MTLTISTSLIYVTANLNLYIDVTKHIPRWNNTKLKKKLSISSEHISSFSLSLTTNKLIHYIQNTI